MSKFIDSLPPSGTNGVTWEQLPAGARVMCQVRKNQPTFGYVHTNPPDQCYEVCPETVACAEPFLPKVTNLAGTYEEIRNYLNKMITRFRKELVDAYKYQEILVKLGFGTEMMVAGRQVVEVAIMAFPKLSVPSNWVQLWNYQGDCPQCGECGWLDPQGGAHCTKHGFYPLVIVPDPGVVPSVVLGWI